MIAEHLLHSYGASEKQLKKGEQLFQEGESACFYYQVISGLVKLNNYSEEGKETIQGLYGNQEGFGISALLGDFPLSENAVAETDTQLIYLEKGRFLKLLSDRADVSRRLLKELSLRMHFDTMLLKEMKSSTAEKQVLTLLNLLKKNAGIDEDYLVDITRQTIGNFVGLRVETVIRILRKLEKDGKVRIRERKLYV